MDNDSTSKVNSLVSEVITYPGLNKSERYIHCSIGGVRQPAKKLSDEDNKRLDEAIEVFRQTKNWAESRAFRLALAEKYYKAEILQIGQGTEQTKGVKF